MDDARPYNFATHKHLIGPTLKRKEELSKWEASAGENTYQKQDGNLMQSLVCNDASADNTHAHVQNGAL